MAKNPLSGEEQGGEKKGGCDFTKNPWGNPSGGAKPRTLAGQEAEQPKQQASDEAEKNSESVPEGGDLPFPATDPAENKGQPIGAGSIGNARKPFKFDGGS